jgi:hypothetical protein
MNMQNIIDREQNAIIKQAHSMTNREMILILIQHGHILGRPYFLTREDIIDRYCQLLFDLNNL